MESEVRSFVRIGSLEAFNKSSSSPRTFRCKLRCELLLHSATTMLSIQRSSYSCEGRRSTKGKMKRKRRKAFRGKRSKSGAFIRVCRWRFRKDKKNNSVVLFLLREHLRSLFASFDAVFVRPPSERRQGHA